MEISKLTHEKLIESALDETDSDEQWKFITVLHQRPSVEVFEIARKLCQSNIASRIELGANILGQLGVDLPFRHESIPILLSLTETSLHSAETEEDIDALQAVIFALGRMEDETARKKILEFTNHKSEDIRFAVVHGILTIEENEEINALIKLSGDADEDVRNWATFGLGSQIDIDTKEIRDALFQRLSEKDHEIRGEALVGLAKRKDERVIKPLVEEISGEEVGLLPVEAAFEAGDNRLCKSLLELKDWWDLDKKLLEDAIKICCTDNE